MTYRVRNPELSQEDDRVPVWRVIVAFSATMVIFAVLIVWAVDATLSREAALRPSGAFPESWLGPRHMVARVREDVFGEQRGAGFNAKQRAALEGYGWVDRGKGLVHIPIDRAIDLVLLRRRP
jgi:hypothetical protein